MKFGDLYKCNKKGYIVKVLGMTEYIQNVNEPKDSSPQYILTQRQTMLNGEIYTDDEYVPAHWDVGYFVDNFTRFCDGR